MICIDKIERLALLLGRLEAVLYVIYKCWRDSALYLCLAAAVSSGINDFTAWHGGSINKSTLLGHTT